MKIATPIIRHYLAQHPLINSLTDHQMQDLECNSKLKTLKKGEFISLCNTDKNTYLILSGRMKIYEMDNEGNSLIKELLKGGDFFGEHHDDNSNIQLECVEAISDHVVISVVTSTVIQEMLKRNHAFSNGYNQVIWKRYKQIEQRYRNLAFLKDTKSRLISLLAEWAKGEGERKGDKIVLETDLTHKDIAGMICSTRVTVTTILNQLRHTGEINYSRGRIEMDVSCI